MAADITLRPNTVLTNITGGKQTRYIDAGNEACGLRISGLKLSSRRGAIRLRQNASDILIENGTIQGKGPQKGSDLPVGFEARDTVHDVTVRGVTSSGHTMVTVAGKYTNGDGFGNERGTYRITFDDCHANDNSDGGFDLKAREQVLTGCSASRNGRSLRAWGDGHTDHFTSIDPRGAHIWHSANLTGDWLHDEPQFIGGGRVPHFYLEGDADGCPFTITVRGGTINGKPITRVEDLTIKSVKGKSAKLVWIPSAVLAGIDAGEVLPDANKDGLVKIGAAWAKKLSLPVGSVLKNIGGTRYEVVS